MQSTNNIKSYTKFFLSAFMGKSNIPMNTVIVSAGSVAAVVFDWNRIILKSEKIRYSDKAKIEFHNFNSDTKEITFRGKALNEFKFTLTKVKKLIFRRKHLMKGSEKAFDKVRRSKIS